MEALVSITLQSELVPLQGSNSLAEQILRLLVALLHAGDIDLLPLHGDIVRLENLLDRFRHFSTDTVAYCGCEKRSQSLDPGRADVPGMRVTVYFPPNLVGLKMSEETLAMPMGLC